MDNLTAGNPVAHRVRVYYAGTSDVAEGMPLCYEYATTTNWFGGSVSDAGVVSATNTTAEGSHNEGKYIRVVDPTALNLAWFAGVVAKGGWVGKTGGLIPLDIYVPNGAIVPVKTVLAATVVGRTILSINSATLTFGNPTTDAPNYGLTAGTIDARPVAIAEETISAAGLVLARLDPNMFIHQGGQVGQELHVGYVGTVNTSVNRMFLDFDQTAGNCQALHCRSLISGAESKADRGVYRFETVVKGSHVGDTFYGIDNILDLSTGYVGTSAHQIGIKSCVRSRGVNPDMTGDYVAAYKSEIILTKTTTGALDAGGPTHVGHFYLNSDSAGTTPSAFLFADKKVFVPLEANALGGSAFAAALTMTIFVEGVEFYIPCYTAAELAA